MFQSIERLKKLGYVPDTIFDIGAYHGKWTESCREIFNTSKYHLFEAIYYPQLFSISNMNTRIYNCLLNDSVKEVDWYEMCNTGDSMFKEIGTHFDNCKVITKTSTTLDIISNTAEILNNSRNIFIKIDCQGAEIPILKGATNVLKKTDFILLELPFFGEYNRGVPTFLEHIDFMNSIGFIPFDFCESHYVNGFTMQVDMLFIRKDHPFTIEVHAKLRTK
jgi:FkbM family methyltransferase